MAWTWNSDFANSENIWVPSINVGFDEKATYTEGVGFVYKDAQLGAASYSRILAIEAEFEATAINTVSFNFDLTKGSTTSDSLNCYFFRS